MSDRIFRSRATPIYLQIYEMINNQIVSGELKPGDRIWSEHEIIDRFQVSRNTAQSAIRELIKRGLVHRTRGKGTFVATQKIIYGLQRLTSYSEEISTLGMTPSSKVLDLTLENCIEEFAEKLRIPLNSSKVYKLKRLRLADSQPMAIHTSYIPEKLCPGLNQFDFNKASIFSIIETHYGYKIIWAEQLVKSAMPNHEEAELLNISKNLPVLVVKGTTYLEEDVPIMADYLIYNSELYEFLVKRRRELNL